MSVRPGLEFMGWPSFNYLESWIYVRKKKKKKYSPLSHKLTGRQLPCRPSNLSVSRSVIN